MKEERDNKIERKRDKKREGENEIKREWEMRDSKRMWEKERER